MLPRADVTSIDLETGKREIHTQEFLSDGERHLGAGLDGLCEAEGGRDGHCGSGVELQGVRQDSQLVNTSRLRSSLCHQAIIILEKFISHSPQNPYSSCFKSRLLAETRAADAKRRRNFMLFHD